LTAIIPKEPTYIIDHMNSNCDIHAWNNGKYDWERARFETHYKPEFVEKNPDAPYIACVLTAETPWIGTIATFPESMTKGTFINGMRLDFDSLYALSAQLQLLAEMGERAWIEHLEKLEPVSTDE